MEYMVILFETRSILITACGRFDRQCVVMINRYIFKDKVLMPKEGSETKMIRFRFSINEVK